MCQYLSKIIYFLLCRILVIYWHKHAKETETINPIGRSKSKQKRTATTTPTTKCPCDRIQSCRSNNWMKLLTVFGLYEMGSFCFTSSWVFLYLPRKIGEARHAWAAPWPKNCPNAISSNMIGIPINRNSNKYGSRKMTPYRSSSRGKRTTFANVRFRHMQIIISRNIEHFD